jgi:hypothetical protein
VLTAVMVDERWRMDAPLMIETPSSSVVLSANSRQKLSMCAG